MAYAPSKSRSLNRLDSKGLNLIPIMNLFIVIIPMLMTIMVSVHLAMIEIVLPKKGSTIPADQALSTEMKTLRLNITTEAFELMIVEDDQTINIPALDLNSVPAKFDFVSLNQYLLELKEQFPKQNTMEILPDPDVKYDTLLRSIDICKLNDFSNIRYKLISTKTFRAPNSRE